MFIPSPRKPKNPAETSFSDKIYKHIKRHPEDCNVVFEVGDGPKKEEIKFSTLLFSIACSDRDGQELTFGEAKEMCVVRFPEMDPKVFNIFLKYIATESVPIEILEQELSRFAVEDLFNLNSICSHFKMRNFEESVNVMIKEFYNNFSYFAKHDFFLKLSSANLLTVLSSDELIVDKEFTVYSVVYRWAISQSRSVKIQPSIENLRKMLGDCVFQIRFPVMCNMDFGKIALMKDCILTDSEQLQVYKFISIPDELKVDHDLTMLPFIAKERWGSSSLSTVSFFEGWTTAGPAFVCESTMHMNTLQVSRKILVYGLSFLGPIDCSAFYKINVKIYRDPENDPEILGELNKTIFATKRKMFHAMFDKPVLLHANWNEDEFDNKAYGIRFSLEGPDTGSVSIHDRAIDGAFDFHCKGEGVFFGCSWTVGQLAQLRFKKL